jgi:hypothetical protein
MPLKWSGFLVVGIVTANLFSVSTVFAQKDMGIRAGVSIDPEQCISVGTSRLAQSWIGCSLDPMLKSALVITAVVWPSMVNSRISFRWRSATQTRISEAALR